MYVYFTYVDALAHMGERKIAYSVITKGGRIGMMTSFNLLMEDICLLQPTTFSTTPRFGVNIFDSFLFKYKPLKITH